jgi:predicted nucleic acid-binding protein
VAEFDLDKALRWLRLGKLGNAPVRRPDELLPFISEGDLVGGELLLDTCVYIDELQGKAPDLIDHLLAVRSRNHSTIALTELMHLFGRLDPQDGRTKKALEEVAGVLHKIPNHRLHEVDADVMARAGALCGLISRFQGYRTDQKFRVLHDCILLLQARKLGLTLLTRNISDFDLLLQIVLDVRIIFYRQK